MSQISCYEPRQRNVWYETQDEERLTEGRWPDVTRVVTVQLGVYVCAFGFYAPQRCEPVAAAPWIPLPCLHRTFHKANKSNPWALGEASGQPWQVALSRTFIPSCATARCFLRNATRTNRNSISCENATWIPSTEKEKLKEAALAKNKTYKQQNTI